MQLWSASVVVCRWLWTVSHIACQLLFLQLDDEFDFHPSFVELLRLFLQVILIGCVSLARNASAWFWWCSWLQGCVISFLTPPPPSPFRAPPMQALFRVSVDVHHCCQPPEPDSGGHPRPLLVAQ